MNNEDINNLGDLSRLEKWRLILGEDADNDEDKIVLDNIASGIDKTMESLYGEEAKGALVKSSPKTLMAISPFTPETASCTLSEIGCENPNTTPGKAFSNSPCIAAISSSFFNPLSHSSLGCKSTKSSMLKKPVGSVPSLGLPF
jgi:hypothetical protein